MLTVRYDALGVRPGDRVLDLGCGFGRHAFESLRRGAEVVACDFSLAELKDVTAMFEAIAAEEAATLPATASGAATNGDATRLPFADASFDRIIASEVLEHIPDDGAAFAELARVLNPAARWPSPCRRGCPSGSAGRCPTSTTPRSSRAATCGSTPSASCGRSCGPPASGPARPTTPTRCTRPYWWLKCAVGPTNDDHPLVRAYHQVLLWDIAGRQPMATVTRFLDRLGNPVIGKSLVVYADKPAAPTEQRAADDVPRRCRRRRLGDRAGGDRRRHRRVAAARRGWSRGSPAATPTRGTTSRRPWRSPSAAGGPRPSGPTTGWSRCSAPTAPGTSTTSQDRVEQDKLDANVCAYVAAGVWHHVLLFDDDGFAEAMWPVVERAIDFVLDLQTPRGEILWARHADGTPWSFALLTGSSLDLPLAALRHRPGRAARPRAARLGAVGRPPRPRHRPRARRLRAEAPLGDGLVLPGALRRRRRRGRPRAAGGAVRPVRRRRPRRPLRERPAVDHRRRDLRVRPRPPRRRRAGTAEELFSWTAQYRHDDGRYWTGTVYPDEARFPAGERSTYTAASVVLAADALAGASPASKLFVDHDAVLPGLMTVDD